MLVHIVLFSILYKNIFKVIIYVCGLSSFQSKIFWITVIFLSTHYYSNKKCLLSL